MAIDKQKLQKLLWAEAASFRADCADWKRNTEALQEFLGERTLEEVALELLAENDRLSASPERQIIRAAVTEAVKGIAEAATADAKAGTLKEIEQLKADNAGLQTGYKAYEQVNAELRAECERLRKDAGRWQFVRNPVGSGSPFAIWSERTNLLLGKFADEAIDAAMGQGERP